MWWRPTAFGAAGGTDLGARNWCDQEDGLGNFELLDAGFDCIMDEGDEGEAALNANPGFQLGSLTMTGYEGEFTLGASGVLAVAGVVYLDSTFANSGALDVDGAISFRGTLTGAGSITVTGSIACDSGMDHSGFGGVVTYDNGSSETKDLQLTAAALGPLAVDASGATLRVLSLGLLTSLTMTAGTFSFGTYDVTFSGNISGTGGTLNWSAGDVTSSGTVNGANITMANTSGILRTCSSVSNVAIPVASKPLDCTDRCVDGGGNTNIWWPGSDGIHSLMGDGFMGAGRAP